MNIVIAPDSFKESMTALEAASAIEDGFRSVIPEANYIKVPMADGGEGTVQSVIDATGGTLKKVTVTGPLFKPVEAFYGLSGDKKLAVIEMASSSGLELVQKEKRNPFLTTTLGFGELIYDALEEGVEELLLGIGGSATNDGGAGMIIALGGKLLNKYGEAITPTGEGIKDLETFDFSELHPRINDVTFKVASDVDNPLIGKNGAAHIYGSQKGGTIEQIKILDQNLSHYADKIEKELNKNIIDIPGAGAAGGLGAGLIAYLDADLQRGGDLLVEILGLEKFIETADLVVTGEGNINHQTIYGKTPVAVSKVAKKYNVPVIAIAGSLSEGYNSVYEEGIDSVFSIIPELIDLDVLLANGEKNIKETSKNIANILTLLK